LINEGVKKNMRSEGINILKPFIRLMKTTQFQQFTVDCLKKAPDYFWEVPASSTGKYHPEFTRTKGGLVKHTAFAMYLGYELCETYCVDYVDECLVLTALALHDTLKRGYTDADRRYFYYHPMLTRNHYKTLREGFETNYDKVMDLIETHMGNMNGEWSPSPNLKPESNLQKIVHLADYIASRPQLDFTVFQEIKQETGGDSVDDLLDGLK
jgi:hypothetical protein